jgi:MFS family permease
MISCALHLVYGRLSDIFGRKTMLQVALFFLAFGNLLCGFAKTPVQLYIFRAISGMGGGGINGIAMVIVSSAAFHISPVIDRVAGLGYRSAQGSGKISGLCHCSVLHRRCNRALPPDHCLDAWF